MQEVKRQHYVPKTYLKHFGTVNNGKNYIHALPLPNYREELIFETNVKEVCVKNDVYTLPGKTPEERMLIEKFYSYTYERHYDLVYSILTNSSKHTVTEHERKLIISTVITMFYRTSKWITLQ